MTLRMVARVQVRKEEEPCEKRRERESKSRMDEENAIKGKEEQLDGMKA